MLMPASTVGEAEAKVRFRQKLCDTSIAIFNYIVTGELHIPQEASFKEFRKVVFVVVDVVVVVFVVVVAVSLSDGVVNPLPLPMSESQVQLSLSQDNQK